MFIPAAQVKSYTKVCFLLDIIALLRKLKKKKKLIHFLELRNIIAWFEHLKINQRMFVNENTRI